MIYFIQDTDTHHIKIGHTSADDAEGRRKALQTGNPSRLVLLAAIDGDSQRERELHRKFAAARVAGEWFRPAPDLLAFLLLVVPSPAPPDSPAWLLRSDEPDEWQVICPRCSYGRISTQATVIRSGPKDGENVLNWQFGCLRCEKSFVVATVQLHLSAYSTFRLGPLSLFPGDREDQEDAEWEAKQ